LVVEINAYKKETPNAAIGICLKVKYLAESMKSVDNTNPVNPKLNKEDIQLSSSQQ
jgi:hypothetical protein